MVALSLREGDLEKAAVNLAVPCHTVQKTHLDKQNFWQKLKSLSAESRVKKEALPAEPCHRPKALIQAEYSFGKKAKIPSQHNPESEDLDLSKLDRKES